MISSLDFHAAADGFPTKPSPCAKLMFVLLRLQQSKNGSVTALIWAALPQPRCDRRKDRVETNPEQLTAASVKAEISFLICAQLVNVFTPFDPLKVVK
ncbi:hypothetical protein FXO38_29851 [Capsicum annuum]|uniref:Uncharacterized protein n=1 Tax=Capsicum annuum TaxID=4072 RepID=A0A2G2ZBS6_CAPAN|nr:hypothetical protein FXO38_29851 [Capsicum annuum]KAF3663676.1 hypothetical protein FXO37_11863 [Capsicum annuum]PHT79448.1 hypothetical protein T459_17500 [Capsicum annuum]